MPTVSPIAAIRKAAVALLDGAGLQIPVAGTPTDVTVLEHPPDSGVVDPSRLPGIYCYVRSEQTGVGSHRTQLRRYLVDFVLQGKGGHSDVIDQVDALDLALEATIATDPSLGGLLYQTSRAGSETSVVRAEISFSSRRVTYEVAREVDPLAPGVTI